MTGQESSMMAVGGLSDRGASAAISAVRPGAELYLEVIQNRYDPVDNPDGALPMNVAENKLGWPALQEKFRAICSTPPPLWTSSYTMSTGAPQVRQAVADFLAAHICGCPMSPDCVGLTAGATAALELAAFLLGDSGDVVAFPAPCYPTYTHDIGAKAGLRRYDIVTHHEPADRRHGPLLSPSHLDEALGDIEGQGARLRLLILTAPDNPTGAVYPRTSLEAIADWCEEHRVHLLVNEIYAASLIDTQRPEISDDYRDHEPFASFGPLLEERQSNYLHYCYAFSKDFGLSGFRLGLLYSRNEALMTGMANLNTAHMASNHTQWLIESLLGDRAFVADFVATNRRLLTDAYIRVVEVLRRRGVPYIPSRGSLFVWVDLSALLTGDGAGAEQALWLEIFRESGLLLTPGSGFGHTKRGMFRIVFPGLSADDLAEAMRRLDRFLAARMGN